MGKKVFVFDFSRCNGCRNCQIACKDEHVDQAWLPFAEAQPDTGQFWLKLNERVCGQVPKVHVVYTVEMCRHCDDAPCMAAAPEAVYRREDGLVIVDPAKAKGCRELVEACPYGAIYYNEELDLPQKCTGCAHLVDEGLPPHCVDVCPHEALRMMDESELPEGAVPAGEVGSPNLYYLNDPKRFVAGCVADLEEDEVVIGAKVTLENLDSGEVEACETDEFGDFWFRRLPEANFRVYVEAEGYLTRTVETSTVEEDKNVGTIGMYKNLIG